MLKDIINPVTTENFVVLTFTRITFGVISGQLMVANSIVHHLMEKKTAASKKIEEDVYIENFFTGSNKNRTISTANLSKNQINLSQYANQSQSMVS